MNTQLAFILEWADSNGVELDRASIVSTIQWDKEKGHDENIHVVSLYHVKEKHSNILALKRAVVLQEQGQPPYVELRGEIAPGIVVKYEGAFTCFHICKPTPWTDEQMNATS